MATCPICAAGNPDGARFCNQCGGKLDAGAGPRADARSYTPRHLADRILRTRSAMQGERKRVTALFADIKGSTRLAQEAGAEAWHEILDRFFSLLANAVHRFEGTVNQYTGDGIMALFGAPIAHEDHGSRACFAALEMQREVRRFADELRLNKNLNLSMRVGLNTGEVIVGRIGDDLRMDYTAQGLTVNLAARMEHICEPGQIYLTRNTGALVEGYFRLRDLGPMKVDGLDAPMEVYALEGEGSVRTRLDRALARGGSPFIGRDRELSQLLDALARVRAGQGQVVAVVGNAGIGKSRLCWEFARACSDAGVVVHRATGVPYASAVPMHPVRQLARSRLGLPENASSQDVRRLVAGTFLLHDPAHVAILPAVFEFLGAGEGAELAPEQAISARQKMLDLIVEYLPCADTPQILMVEDLHFLDSGSEEFLAALCQRIRPHKTLLLLNYRPEYVSEWLIPSLDEQVGVSALTGDQLEELARNLLGPDPALRAVARTVRERASGNPFFVEEAVQALVESGHLEGERGAYTLARPIEAWAIPDTVHALLAARIDRLPDLHKSLLQTAAVIGQEFQPSLLATLADGEGEPFDEQLAVLEDAGFVNQKQSEPVLEYAFCHPLMQEVAYHGQLETRRAAAHARLAQELESRHPIDKPDATAVQIAHHLTCAGEWVRAAAWNMAAARWGGARDMNGVRDHYREAMANLERAPLTPEVRRMRIAARAGMIRMAQFFPASHEEVERAYAEAKAMADECGDIAGAAELMISYGNEQLHRGDADAAARLSSEAAKLCLDSGNTEMVQRFRLAILLTHNASGRTLEGLRLCDLADPGWRTRPIDEDNFMSRGFYGLMLAWLGRVPEARINLDGAIAFARREDRAASWMHANLVDVAWFSGEYRSALHDAREAVLRAEAFGSPFFTALSTRAMGLALSLNRQYAEAIACLEQSLPLVLPGGFAHQFEAHYLSTLALAYAGAGHLERARDTAEQGIASAQGSHSRVWEVLVWLAWFRLVPEERWRARADEGFARCEALVTECGAEGFRPWLEWSRSFWARDAGARRDFEVRAADGFERIGAFAHAQRLRQGA